MNPRGTCACKAQARSCHLLHDGRKDSATAAIEILGFLPSFSSIRDTKNETVSEMEEYKNVTAVIGLFCALCEWFPSNILHNCAWRDVMNPKP